MVLALIPDLQRRKKLWQSSRYCPASIPYASPSIQATRTVVRSRPAHSARRTRTTTGLPRYTPWYTFMPLLCDSILPSSRPSKGVGGSACLINLLAAVNSAQQHSAGSQCQQLSVPNKSLSGVGDRLVQHVTQATCNFP